MEKGLLMGDTGEIHRNGNGAFSKYRDAVITFLTGAAIVGGVAAYVKSEVTATSLVEHRTAEKERIDGLATDIKSMRAELLEEIRRTRDAVERRK